MKFTDIYTSFQRDIDLQRFHPKINIEVESFNSPQKKIDLAQDLEHTLDSSGNKNIHIRPLSKKQKPFDSVFIKDKQFIIVSPKIKKRFKLGYIKSKLIGVGEKSKSLLNSSKLIKYISVIILIFCIGLCDKFLIEYNTNAGYKKLLSLQNTSNSDINSTIKAAKTNFLIAEILFTPFKIIQNKKIQNANHIIEGGREITNTLQKNMAFGLQIKNLIQKKGVNNVMFSQLLLNNKFIFQNLEKDIINIENIYNMIEFSSQEKELNIKLNNFKQKLKQAKFYSYTINNNFDTFLEILGHSKRKKYLIAFQNNDEIRPTGGFMGSIGLVEIFRGQVKKFTKNDVYFHEFKIKKENFQRENAPEGINKMTPYLGLRDSNYYINHKDSGDKIKYFMGKSGHSIDGIIYINMNTLSKVLDLVGEFESKTLNQKINSNNFSTIMSLLVETKISQKGTTGTPKQILFDFMKEFQTILLDKKISQAQVVRILIEDISNRDITLYSFNKQERGLMESISLYNPIDYFSSLDFSYPVFTSISGNKSDRYVKHSYTKTISKGTQCSFRTSLNLKIHHTFTQKVQIYLEKLLTYYDITTDISKVLFIQGNGANKQYVRVIIPKEAEILNKNVTIIDYKDRGQSVNFYMNTSVGEKSAFKLEYYLPNKECKTYSYKFYKQPGIKNYDIEIDNFGEQVKYLNNKKDVYIN